MRYLLLAALIAASPAHADKIDDAKALLKRPEATQALQAITTPARNYIWARDLLTGAPSVTPPVTPPASGGIPIANNAALQAALKDDATFDLAPGNYTLSLSGRKNITINAAPGVVFGQWLKLASTTNIVINGGVVKATTKGDSNTTLVSISKVSGVTLNNVGLEGVPNAGNYGHGVWCKDSCQNVRVIGGYARYLDYAYRFNTAINVTISGVEISHITSDGLQIGGGSHDVLFTKNIGRNWAPARGAHPDWFQAVGPSYNITVSYTDFDGNGQGINQYGNAANAPGGTTNFVVEYNKLKLGGYANAVYMDKSTGRVTGNQLFKATYNPMIRIFGGGVAVSGNTLNGNPYP